MNISLMKYFLYFEVSVHRIISNLASENGLFKVDDTSLLLIIIIIASNHNSSPGSVIIKEN